MRRRSRPRSIDSDCGRGTVVRNRTDEPPEPRADSRIENDVTQGKQAAKLPILPSQVPEYLLYCLQYVRGYRGSGMGELAQARVGICVSSRIKAGCARR